MTRSAIVVGAGVGGLTAALELRRLGYDVLVVEQRSELAEVNTGFLLWAFAVRRLAGLGLADRVEAIGEPLGRLITRTKCGHLVSDVLLDPYIRRMRAATYDVHRAGLQRLLADALGEERIRLGTRCTGLTDRRDGVLLEGGGVERADLVVAADGVASTVRPAVARDARLRRGAFGVWRGVAPLAEDELPRGVHLRFMGEGAVAGMGRLDHETVRWYAGTRMPEGRTRTPEERRATAFERFGDWCEPLRSVLARTPAADYLFNDTPWALPLRTWTAGRAALLGDAAHPVLPTLAMGGGMAIEDAAVLGSCLRIERDTLGALRLYERRRRRTAAVIQSASLGFGTVVATRRLAGLRDLAMARSASAQARIEGWLMQGGHLS